MAQNLTYTRCGDYLIPDVSVRATQAINRLGNMEGCAERFCRKQSNASLDDIDSDGDLVPTLGGN
ncbi:MAG: hypothetical protein ACLU6P_11460 [Roseburia intestinalis]